MRSEADLVPDWLLERLAAGELPASQAAQLRGLLAAQGQEHRLTALAESNREVLASLPAETVVAEVRRRAAAARPPVRRAKLAFGFALATCAAALAVFLVLHDQRPPYDGIKGDPSLRIHRKTASGDELLSHEAVVRRGDTLQLGYIASGRRYGVIASVDARGAITLHLPESPGSAVALEQSGEHTLPHSYELDDSPGFERFVFVAADTPFATAEITSALKRGARLSSKLRVYEVTVRKDTP